MDENKNEEIGNDEELTQQPEESLEIIESKSKVLPIVTGILVGIVGIAIATLIVLYYTSPKNRFFSLVSGSFTSISKEVNKLENSVWGELLSINTDSKIVADVKMEGSVDTENQEIKDWVQNLESFKLNTTEKIDFANNYCEAQAEFILDGDTSTFSPLYLAATVPSVITSLSST